MRKLLLLFIALLTGVSGAWADETVTIINDAAGGQWPNGSYSSDNGGSTWKSSWTTTSTTPQITVSANTYLLQNSTGYIGSSASKTGNYSISINDGYLITGYEIVFENVNTDGSHNQTITPNGRGSFTATGTASATATVTGLTTQAAHFTLTGENTYAKVTKFTVTYINSSSWSSGVTGVGGSGNYYSTTWYLYLTTPNVNDIFLDNFTLGFASDGRADTELETYLAFTQEKFSEQNNHKASEFLAISSNSISGHSSATANIKAFNFNETVRLNGNTTVYVCFVSKNLDGTYNLQKRGIAVKDTGAASGLKFCSGNTYTTTEARGGNYQCQYSCNYTTNYAYPQDTQDNYYIWSGLNYADKTSGGEITIAGMKYTAPGTSGQYVHFDQFSLSLRDAKVPVNTYLLFSKENRLTSDVTETTEFDPSGFTAISINKVPSADYGKIYTFAFDSDSYLDGGTTYYIYMGTKQSNGKFRLTQYGLFINHQMNDRGITTDFYTYPNLTGSGACIHDAWQAIYYTSKCTFADSKIALNIKEAGLTIRTKTIYANADVNVKTALNLPSVFTVTPATITYAVGSSSQDVTINSGFIPSSTPATEANHRYFFKLHGLYAGGDNGKTLSSETTMSENDQWAFGGNYYDGYTIYNVGQAKYLSVSNADNSQGTFVAEANAAKFIVATSGANLSFRLFETNNCYLNNRGNILSTWNNSGGATAEGSRVDIEDPLVSLYDYELYSDVNTLIGTTLGKYTNSSYTQDDVNTALADYGTAKMESNARDFISSFITLRGIRAGWVLNMPADNTFLRISSFSQDNYLSNTNNQYGNINKVETKTGDNEKGTRYLFKDNHLINFANGYAISERYADYEKTYFATMGEVNSTPTSINFSAASARSRYNIGFKDNTRSLKINEYATDAGESEQTGGDYDFVLENVTSLPITLNAAGDGNYYATLCLPCDVTIEGANAYTLSISGSWAVPTVVTSNQVPAGTPVLLKGTSATATATINTDDSFGPAIGNALTGTYAAIDISSTKGSDYYLGRYRETDSDPYVVGFYHWDQNVLSGFRAYLTNATVSGSLVKGFAINWGGETGVESIEHSPLTIDHEAGAMFDLSGRRVSKAQKGLYIQNGKKVMVK